MSWSNWFPMTESGIGNAPQRAGVYQLNSDNGLLYFGQSQNIRERLLQHLGSDDSCISKATKFVFQESDNPEKLEGTLLSNFKDKNGKLPPCNEQG